jgi:hypothetical protein
MRLFLFHILQVYGSRFSIVCHKSFARSDVAWEMGQYSWRNFQDRNRSGVWHLPNHKERHLPNKLNSTL